ncbi:MAG TPA: type II toxin-antitoxin system VapC family toxin [Thermoanaerobaculia bacterium]|nr:type II toxin-antitoxin system VapC family toxin [Thermoanaerobaculia bacterium]
MRYVLDTNTCIYALKGQGKVAERMRFHRPNDIAITTVTLAELWFGAHKSSRRAARNEVDDFLEPFKVLPFDRDAADSYSRLRFDLERIGRPIGERDLLIASIALALDLTVVTHNLREFTRVPGLKVEDWH